uniref:Uncharacterized protein n=1 Tax=Psilocybe cubensis TaxID=181762 RepID=A0A8H7Y7L6_PSICU
MTIPAQIGSDSDTESDSSHSPDSCATYSAPIDAYSLPVWDPRHLKWATFFSFKCEYISEDIATVLEYDLLCPIDSTTSNFKILRSSARLLASLAHITQVQLEDMNDISHHLDAFAMLIDPILLKRLFEHRKLFREAARTHCKNSRLSFPTNVTWVDEFIAKLCSLVPMIASGFIHRLPVAINENIQAQKFNDVLRAASQLPEEWQSLNTAVGSCHFSPAAKRMGMSLLFAVYVMRPTLVPGSMEQISSPSSFLDDLVKAARRISAGIHSPAMSLDTFDERLSAAMLLSILSMIIPINESNSLSAVKPLHLRPEALGTLLDLIWMIMGNDADSYFPLEVLDTSHVILLRWGNVVPWIARNSANRLSSILPNSDQQESSDFYEDAQEPKWELRAAKCLLEFLTIVSTQENGAICDIVQFYIDVIIGILKARPNSTFILNLLLAPVLTAVCISKNTMSDYPTGVKDEDIWFMAIHVGCRNLVHAVVFSHFILASGEVCEPLLCFEAWNFLSATLIAIVEQSLPEDEEQLAPSVFTAICLALRRLIYACNLSTRKVYLSEPLPVLKLKSTRSTHPFLTMDR